jgi:hypothetical protein
VWSYGVLFPEAGALGNSKTVLLVNHNETEIIEHDIIFKYSMSADKDVKRPVAQLRVNNVSGFLWRGAGEKLYVDAEWCDEFIQCLEMLCSQNFGWRYKASLCVVVERDKHTK